MEIEKRICCKEDDLGSGEVFALYSKRVVIQDKDHDYHSYVESSVRISVNEDGSLFLEREEDFIVLFPDQIEHLERAVKKAKEQAEK